MAKTGYLIEEYMDCLADRYKKAETRAEKNAYQRALNDLATTVFRDRKLNMQKQKLDRIRNELIKH